MEVYPEQSNVVLNDENEPTLDRAIGEEFMISYHKGLYSNGLLSNDLTFYKVTPVTGLKIKINRGLAVGGGRFFYESSNIELELTSSPIAITKYLITIQYRKADRMATIIAKQGEITSTELIRTADIYELGLAIVTVPMNATQIGVSNITDVRLDPDFCGISAGMNQVDTGGIFDQYQASLDEFLQKTMTILTETETRLDELTTDAQAILNGISTDINLVVLSVTDFDADDRFPGTIVTTDLNAIPMTEERRFVSDGFLLATRTTLFDDNIITETTRFYAKTWTVDGRTFQSTASTRTVVTDLQTLESEVF